jgi:hypothetical protein
VICGAVLKTAPSVVALTIGSGYDAFTGRRRDAMPPDKQAKR